MLLSICIIFSLSYSIARPGRKSGILGLTNFQQRTLDIMPKSDFVSVPSSCTLCPRRCGADRAAGRTGFCGAGGTKSSPRCPALLGGAMHQRHKGAAAGVLSPAPPPKPPPQNYPISAEGLGKEISVEHLAEIFPESAGAGCQQHQSGHTRPVAALDHCRAGYCPG